ncbi:MAG TPA: hypothetical protein VMP11_20215 [Verrucomicrobiae bacterium]|nr:hypothetical protein [Verrucomicrobiae bacterium]
MKRFIGTMGATTAARVTVGCETRWCVIRGNCLGAADGKMLARSGISDEVIIGQIRNSRTVYHLRAADIHDLRNAGVTEKVIDFMVNTPSLYRYQSPLPPPLPSN